MKSLHVKHSRVRSQFNDTILPLLTVTASVNGYNLSRSFVIIAIQFFPDDIVVLNLKRRSEGPSHTEDTGPEGILHAPWVNDGTGKDMFTRNKQITECIWMDLRLLLIFDVATGADHAAAPRRYPVSSESKRKDSFLHSIIPCPSNSACEQKEDLP